MSTAVTMVLYIALDLDQDFDGHADHAKLADYLITRDWDDLNHLDPMITSSDILQIESNR